MEKDQTVSPPKKRIPLYFWNSQILSSMALWLKPLIIFFVSVSAHLPPFDSSVIHGIQPDLPAQYVIDPIHVEYRLTQINIYKSPGPDGLPNWLLRELAPLLSQPLAAIFNASLRQGYLYHRSGNLRRLFPFLRYIHQYPSIMI